MAPPALSTRDTRTLQPSIYHLPIQQHSPSLPLIRFSRYYSLAPALPTLDSLILDLPFFLSSFLFPFLFLLFPLLVCFKPYTFSVSRFLFSSLRQRPSRFPSGLLPFHPNPSLFFIALASTYCLFNSVSGSPRLLYRTTARGLLYRENDSLESRSRR